MQENTEENILHIKYRNQKREHDQTPKTRPKMARRPRSLQNHHQHLIKKKKKNLMTKVHKGHYGRNYTNEDRRS